MFSITNGCKKIMVSSSISTVDDLMTEGGEMGELIRSIASSKTLVGPVEPCGQSLRTPISMLYAAKRLAIQGLAFNEQ
jgi:hypothetical protein